MAGPRSEWLLTTINAVRERMVDRLARRTLDEESELDIQMALEEIETMWEELVGQSEILAVERERYRDFFENAPDAYAVTDEGCAVREANRALADLLGVACGELLGKPLSHFVEDGDRAGFLANVVGSVHGPERPMRWRARFKGPDGKLLPVHLTVRAMPLRRSGVRGLCWLLRPAD